MPARLAHRNDIGVLELSQGTLNLDYTNRPAWELFPNTVTARIVITDSSGSQLAEWTSTLVANKLNFTVAAADQADIPVGSNYVLLVTWDDGHEYQWEYGRVVRPQVVWPTRAAEQTQNQALVFTYVPGTAVGAHWLPKGGTGGLKVWDNSAFSLPNGLGINNAFFATAAAIWDTPFATDSVKIVVKCLNGGAGKSAVVLCSDINMNSYLAVAFESGISNNKIHICTGTGPTALVDQITPVNNTVANNDVYAIVYDDVTKALAVYKGDSLTPLASWTDEDNVVPHGAGYRYGGVNFNASLLSPGVEFATWAMKDN